MPNMRVDLTPLVGWKTFLRGPDRMVFEGLPPDSYSVTAEAEGYTSGSDRVTVTQQKELYSVVIWLKKKEEENAPTPRLTARLDCGGSFELAPGASKSCSVIVEGWRSNTADRVEVVFFPNPPPEGITVSPGNTSEDPGNMHTAGVSDRQGEYPFSEGFSASDKAVPGTTPFQIVVRQRGVGQVNLTLNVAVLRKGLLPSSGPGIRPPATVAAGTGGEFCVWRYKLFGDPPACFHFAAAKCDTPRYNKPRGGYELVGSGMKWSEADARVEKLSRYFNDAFGCLRVAAQPATPPAHPTPPVTPVGPVGPTPPLPPLPPPTEEPPQHRKRVLSRFGVSCHPDKIKVGQSASCQATGEYSDKPGVIVNLTGAAAWSPGPTIRGDSPGSYFARATHEGASDTATVTVMEDEKKRPTDDGGKKPPDIKGATEKGTTFRGQTPGGKPPEPTSSATGGDQPIEQPGQKSPPAGPEGPAPATAGGQPPPQQGIQCYSEKTKEYYMLPYRPCPSPWMKPPAGTTTASQPPGRAPWQGLVPGRRTPGTGTETPPQKPSAPPPTTPPTTLSPPKTPPTTPGSGVQGVDLSGTWHTTYNAPLLGNLRFTMTLSRVAAGRWQGPLDYVVVDCPEMSFKTQATLQATGVGKVHLTYNTPAKECPRYVGKIGAGAQQADGTYTSSQITFGVAPNTVTYTRK